jgi:DNA-binding GntR family transcriptional regulator
MPEATGAVTLGTHGRRLIDRVHEGLQQAIREGRLQPGDRLILLTLAHELGVSLSPVREAVARLAQEGLVDLEPHRGAIVTRLSRHDIEDIYDVREALESFAVAQAIARRTTKDIDCLEEICRRSEAQAHDLTLAEWFQVNREFHYHLVAPCRNSIIMETLDGLWDRQAAVMMLLTYTREPQSVEQLLIEHRALADAFAAGKVDLAKALVHSHIQDGREELIARLQSDEPQAREGG